MHNGFIKILLATFVAAFLLLPTSFGLAQTLVPGVDGVVDCSHTDSQYCTGDYGMSDFLKIAITASRIILGLTGSLALLAFVYGGSLLLISAGNRERVEQGKKAMVGAVVGIAIVLLAYTVIGVIFTTFGIENWYSAGWMSSRS